MPDVAQGTSVKPLVWKDQTLAGNGRPVCENFSAWFGSSCVVDYDAAPRVVFHGTRGPDFDTFQKGIEAQNHWEFGSFKTRRHAICFAEEPDFAEVFTRQGAQSDEAGPRIIPAYLRVLQPLDLTESFYGLPSHEFDALQSFFDQHPWVLNISMDSYWELLDEGSAGTLDFIDAVRAAGFDGIKMFERDRKGNGHDVWAVFEAAQIKSALGNTIFLRDSASLTDQAAAMALENARRARQILEPSERASMAP